MSECEKCKEMEIQFEVFIDRIRNVALNVNNIREANVLDVLERNDYKAIVKYRIANLRYYGEVINGKVPKVLTYVLSHLDKDKVAVKYNYSIHWVYLRDIDATLKNAITSRVQESSISDMIEDIWVLDKNIKEFRYESATMYNVSDEYSSKFKKFIDNIENEHFGDNVFHII